MFNSIFLLSLRQFSGKKRQWQNNSIKDPAIIGKKRKKNKKNYFPGMKF